MPFTKKLNTNENEDTEMKKLIAILPASLLLAACASTSMYHTMSPTEQFSCDENTSVNVQYSKSGDIAKVNVNIPQLGLNNQPITLEQAVSASGSRYVNEHNPEVAYEWHTKADEGIFSIYQKDGVTHQLSCKK